MSHNYENILYIISYVKKALRPFLTIYFFELAGRGVHYRRPFHSWEIIFGIYSENTNCRFVGFHSVDYRAVIVGDYKLIHYCVLPFLFSVFIIAHYQRIVKHFFEEKIIYFWGMAAYCSQ